MAENTTDGVNGSGSTGGTKGAVPLNDLLAKLKAKISQNATATGTSLKDTANNALNAASNASKEDIKDVSAIVGDTALQKFDKNMDGLQYGEVINALEAKKNGEI